MAKDKKRGRSSGAMLQAMGLASSHPGAFVQYRDHDRRDDPAARLELFRDYAAKLSLSYDLELKGATIRIRFSLESRS